MDEVTSSDFVMTKQMESSTAKIAPESVDTEFAEDLARLEGVFGVRFSILDANTGELLDRASDTYDGDWLARGELCKEVAARRTPEIIEDHDDLLLLAIPLCTGKSACHVAVASFLTGPAHEAVDHDRLAGTLGVSRDEVERWVRKQSTWSAERLLNLAELLVQRDSAKARSQMLVKHINELSDNLSSTYEEISLLHRITANLKISCGTDELANMALEWLHEVIPADGLAAYLRVTGKPEDVLPEGGQGAVLLTKGACPVDAETFEQIVEHLELSSSSQMVMLNRSATQQDPWRYTSIRELMIVTLSAGNKVLGYLAAFNHTEGGEFGTVGASMLSSVATMLGIHSGNIELYREQVQLLSGMVRAMVTAIDAKDPYTCGHSNRVARVSLRLAEQLNCADHMKNTVYLAGLLHDIGKIGIDDSVLRKPGRLTDEEFEHLKQHPELGYNILRDIDRIKDVLPGVLHHHEAWNGKGYPGGLAGADIPLLARIIAVADSFDAMSSDRPYRDGIDDERIDSILRDGAGSQWDEDVVDAYFAVRDEIREIAERDREHLQLDMHDFA